MDNIKQTLIEPGRLNDKYWTEIWHYHELFAVLAWRDIAIRYKQTAFGVAWALIQPLMTMFVFTIIFNKIARIHSEHSAPYALVVLTGLLPWQLFSTSIVNASGSLIGNSNLISKVYFPRMIIPAASVIVSLVDSLVSFVILAAMLLWYHYEIHVQILALPLLIFFAFLASLGPGLLFSSLNVKYRDFRYIIPFMVQFGLYISPVGFSSSLVPDSWRNLYYLNPMAGLIDSFRWAILADGVPLYVPGLAISSGVVVVLTAVGIFQFRKMEKTFADII